MYCWKSKQYNAIFICLIDSYSYITLVFMPKCSKNIPEFYGRFWIVNQRKKTSKKLNLRTIILT